MDSIEIISIKLDLFNINDITYFNLNKLENNKKYFKNKLKVYEKLINIK